MAGLCRRDAGGSDVSPEALQEYDHEQNGLYQKYAVKKAKAHSRAEAENSMGSAGAVRASGEGGIDFHRINSASGVVLGKSWAWTGSTFSCEGSVIGRNAASR